MPSRHHVVAHLVILSVQAMAPQVATSYNEVDETSFGQLIGDGSIPDSSSVNS